MLRTALVRLLPALHLPATVAHVTHVHASARPGLPVAGLREGWQGWLWLQEPLQAYSPGLQAAALTAGNSLLSAPAVLRLH
jgi:hypothetical protein